MADGCGVRCEDTEPEGKKQEAVKKSGEESDEWKMGMVLLTDE